jgi:pyruvate dehydrogenase E2 component (dihydrolipoamide acetyltransferase)
VDAVNTVTSAIELRVPDIGDFKDIPIIELLVKPGDLIALNDSIATLESEKATLDVPATISGRVLTVAVACGHRVSKGSLLITVEPSGAKAHGHAHHETAASSDEVKTAQAQPTQPMRPPARPAEIRAETADGSSRIVPITSPETIARAVAGVRIYAGPSVRRIGRELGVDLMAVEGSGRGGRVLSADVYRFVRANMSRPTVTAAPSTAPLTPGIPPVDFGKFGDIERQPLSRIRRISGVTLARNWATIPHVTNFDEADITDLESFRQDINREQRDGAKITLLSFLIKASAVTLNLMPAFNASLDGENIVLKKYVHIGVAVDTPGGLLVPVLRNADRLGIAGIASGLAAKAALAREGKLKVSDMEGGCFTISSLGGVGGTGFTPIINAPEIAILGAGRARIQPHWDGEKFLPRLIVPLSLSWDHRALDGVAAARFLVQLVKLLEDFRRVTL